MEVTWEKPDSDNSNLYGQAGHDTVAVVRDATGMWATMYNCKVIRRGIASMEGAKMYLEAYCK